jgi:hypothetical protein
MLKTFFVLAFSYAAEGREYGEEMLAWTELRYREWAVFRLEHGHVVEEHLHHPKTALTDDDLDRVAKLHRCRKLLVGGTTTPHGLLTLFPKRRLKELWANGEQFTHESIQPFYRNRPDVDIVPAKIGEPCGPGGGARRPRPGGN